MHKSTRWRQAAAARQQAVRLESVHRHCSNMPSPATPRNVARRLAAQPRAINGYVRMSMAALRASALVAIYSSALRQSCDCDWALLPPQLPPPPPQSHRHSDCHQASCCRERRRLQLKHARQVIADADACALRRDVAAADHAGRLDCLGEGVLHYNQRARTLNVMHDMQRNAHLAYMAAPDHRLDGLMCLSRPCKNQQAYRF
jgi:hypothetical protein